MVKILQLVSGTFYFISRNSNHIDRAMVKIVIFFLKKGKRDEMKKGIGFNLMGIKFWSLLFFLFYKRKIVIGDMKALNF